MDIIIIAHFCIEISRSNNGRFAYIADLLAKSNSVEIVTSDFDHSSKKPKVRQFGLPFKITYLHEPPYRKNVCAQRFWSHFEWGLRVRGYLQKRAKPDVIYCAVPSLTGPFFAGVYCRRNSVRFVIDVQDLWPEAFQMVFHVPVLSSAVFFPFRVLANCVYKKADAICAVSKTYADRALCVNTKCSEAVSVFLGTDMYVFDRNVRENRDRLYEMTKRRKETLWMAYCGTLGSSYDLISVLEALNDIGERGFTAPVFIVIGDGPRRTEFEEKARQLGVDAVFTGWIPYDQMCALLCQCDMAVNPIAKGAAQSIINKHADYAAACLPVISTQESQEYKALIDTYKMGFNCCDGDWHDMADKILQLANDDDLREQMGRNARRCAEEKFDRCSSYYALVEATVEVQAVE